MARSSFPVEVLTPEGKVFDDEVEMVSTRTGTGSLGVLANHAPLMAMLEPSELKLHLWQIKRQQLILVDRIARISSALSDLRAVPSALEEITPRMNRSS